VEMRSPRPAPLAAGFTLVELLVVIAVIGILAGMLFATIPGITRKRTLATATAELNEVSTAIEAYKAKYGFYPPDNPGYVAINPLYYELSGTVSANGGYQPIDGSATVTTAAMSVLGVNGFANSSTSINGDEDHSAPINFLKGLRNDRIGTTNRAGVNVKLLVCSITWDGPTCVINPGSICPFQYNSSHATNNLSSYDLWVDLFIGGKTNRISNWSKQPQIVH